MTFSIIGRCERTGMFGVAITTSSICVGARCPHARAGVGAVATQNVTDPALGPAILDHLEAGLGSQAALAAAMADQENLSYRQLTVVDKTGTTASFTGENILGTNAVAEGSGCFAAGNLLRNAGVPAAMAAGFDANPGAHIADRLLQGLEAGAAAGGEEGPTHSAALLVVDKMSFPLVDLRMDWDDADPIARLRGLWAAYEPEMLAYLSRATNPSAAPSYGVPGDQ